MICAVYQEAAMTARTCQKRLAKLSAGAFLLDGAPRSDRRAEAGSARAEALLENSQRHTTWERVDKFKISKSNVENHLHELGYVNHFEVWVPYKLRKKNLLDHISTCNSLLQHNGNTPLLKQILTDDEKWILNNNVEWKRFGDEQKEPPPTIPKARSLHPKKVMLCTWWDWKGVLYYELFLKTQTRHSSKYCSQLDQLKAELNEKPPESVNRKHNLPSK